MRQALEARVNVEGYAETAPFAELDKHILGDERDMGIPADELELLGSGFGRYQGKVRRAIGRGNRHIGAAGLKARVKEQLKAEKVHKEVQAAVQITDKNRHRLKTQICVLPVKANRGLVRIGAWRVTHGRAL